MLLPRISVEPSLPSTITFGQCHSVTFLLLLLLLLMMRFLSGEEKVRVGVSGDCRDL